MRNKLQSYQIIFCCRNKKKYSVMIDRQNLFDQPVRSNLITYGSIKKIATGYGDDYAGGCSLDYN